MIKYHLSVLKINNNGEKDYFGCIIPEIISRQMFTDKNDLLVARRQAFEKAKSFQDVFNDFNTNANSSEIVHGIEDLSKLIDTMDETNLKISSHVEIDLWFGKMNEEFQQPDRNRLIFGNRISKSDQLENLAKELIFLESLGINDMKIETVNYMNITYKIISDTPLIDEIN